MSHVLFIGPTLGRTQAIERMRSLGCEDVRILPPAARGDVVRVARRKPESIGIVDGYFHSVPSIHHKEILWALAAGIRVYGAASMGALRAAELADYGMVGVGGIYREFADGNIEDDDEVAVLHAPAELEYRPLTEAMVNIRATLRAAVTNGILQHEEGHVIAQIAKATFYQERTFPAILALAGQQGLPAETCARFAHWLRAGMVNQKLLDALELLDTMVHDANSNVGKPRTTFHLEHTVFWDRLQRDAGWLHQETSFSGLDLLDELRLQPGGYQQALLEGRLRRLLLQESERSGLDTAGVQNETWQTFRRAHGINDQDELYRWLAANDLNHADLETLLTEEAAMRLTLDEHTREPVHEMLNHLRANGRYAGLRARAAAKAEMIAELGGAAPTPEGLGISPDSLIRWHLGDTWDRVRNHVPQYARYLGFADLDSFVQAVAAEYAFTSRQASASEGSAQKLAHP